MTMIPLKQAICLAALLAMSLGDASAKIELPFIFTDHAILQAGQPVPVWGKAAPGGKVTIEFAGQAKTTTADPQGQWMVKLDSMAATSTPGTLVIRDPDGEVDLTDILVGEVWFCSGQSNMDMPLGKFPPTFVGAVGGEEEIAKPEQPNLRLFCWVKKNKEWGKAGLAGWERANPTSRVPFSAVAYFFGNALQNALKEPVGVINISAGGSPISPWIPKEDAMKLPIVSHYFDIYKRDEATITEYSHVGGRYQLAMNQKPRPVPPPILPDPLPYEDMIAARVAIAGGLYDEFVAPVVPYGIRGVIWYQGEANSDNVETASHYEEMLRMLITSWREKWGQPNLPFYFVQLPCWDSGPEKQYPWHVNRQSMLNVLNSMPNVGMAVTVDVGDVHNLHPPNKRPVGERLALWALAKVYNQNVVYSGPLVQKVTNEGDKLRVTFNTFGSTLKIHGSAWQDVEVAGEDGLYFPAVATVNATDALVSSAPVPKPVKVRYGWKPVFTPTLFNQEGLPASPFSFSTSDPPISPK